MRREVSYIAWADAIELIGTEENLKRLVRSGKLETVERGVERFVSGSDIALYLREERRREIETRAHAENRRGRKLPSWLPGVRSAAAPAGGIEWWPDPEAEPEGRRPRPAALSLTPSGTSISCLNCPAAGCAACPVVTESEK